MLILKGISPFQESAVAHSLLPMVSVDTSKCKALKSSTLTPTQRVFESAFREYGLFDSILTDNGAPFSTVAAAGLSRLAVWWIRLEIRPKRIMTARPDQNGRHERMHRTLKAATAKPPRSSFQAQQRAFDRFRQEYN